MNLISQNKELMLSDWKSRILDTSVLPILQKKIDESERGGRKEFEDFNDLEMIQWFLLKREYLDKNKERSERTLKEYKRELTQFVQYLIQYAADIHLDIKEVKEDSLFKSLEKRHIRRYHEWLKSSSPHVKEHGNYSAATLARKTTIIKSFLQFLYENQYIYAPIHEGFYKATVRKDDRPNRDLGPQEVIQLLDYFRKKEHPIIFSIIHILTTTGLRNEEFCHLQVKDFHYDTITRQYYLDIKGKGNKWRQVPLREKTINSIRMFRYARGLDDIEVAQPNDPMFTTNTKKAFTPSYLSQYLSSQIKKADLSFIKSNYIKITPHVFRHAFAIISRLSGVDIYDIMRSLGHEKIETTMIYLEKVFEKEKHAILKWNSDIFDHYI
ncbi:tyrosine-type recombinase/integrase [Caldifermentibacillus hisashii]|uniref:tyrosine-type recombinase/integrase n=3 Tax=Bacillati TaxID=1783272 RepID=UPI0022B9B482|nr:tyrosine-type recombinase/integrase [Caldifermentibacillus hisashii]